MHIIFKNDSSSVMTVTVAERKYVIAPANSVDVFAENEKTEFLAESCALHELVDAVNEIDDKDKSVRFRDRMLTKFAKKVAQKLPDTVLHTAVKYELDSADCSSGVIHLYDGAYTVFDGRLADFLDLIPISFLFARAETSHGNLRIADAKTTNRKEFLKLIRRLLLFMHAGLTALNLLFFIPEYLVASVFSSGFYIKSRLVRFYKKSADERAELFTALEEEYDKPEQKKRYFPAAIKALIVIAALCGIVTWGITSEPEVIIAEDFGTVICFEETFVKTNGGLPSDAEKSFLEDYSAFYPLTDGGYDTENYYCYIYETDDGTRYMWLKDNCSNKENAKKDYADYEDPMVYISVGETQ